MQVVKCKNNHYYDFDRYMDGCPHCAAGVEPFEDEVLDINKIYTDKYVGGKKGQKLREKQAKILQKENAKAQKSMQKQADKVAKKAKKAAKNQTMDETVALAGMDATVMLDGEVSETVMLDASGNPMDLGDVTVETPAVDGGDETVMM